MPRVERGTRASLSISDVAPSGSEFSRTFDQPPLPFRLFLTCDGLIRQPINRPSRQIGSRSREFTTYPPSRISP